jgi:hypothetical protein
MNNFDTSTWKEFLVKNLFRFENPKGKLTTKDLIEGNDIPYIAAKKTNNGVAKMCSRANIPDDQVMKGNCIVFVQQGDGSAGYTTYQKEDFYAISCVTCGYIDGIMNESIGLFLVSILDKNKAFYNHSNSWSGDKLLNTKILLPATETCEPDWNYMQERIAELEQERIAELEQERIAELEQYLIATGLNDYELTDGDKQILATKLTGGASQSSESGSGCWKEARLFRIGDLFEKPNLRWIASRKFNKATDLSLKQTNEFDLPLVNAKNGNNGIMYYGRRADFSYVDGGIDIVNDGAISTGNVYPQPYDVGVLYNAYIVTLKSGIKSATIYEFIACSLGKSIKQLFDYNNKACWDKVKECTVLLPIQTADNEPFIDSLCTYHQMGYTPDWDFMDKYIRAIEKVVIADVVKYKDEVIANTKAMTL